MLSLSACLEKTNLSGNFTVGGGLIGYVKSKPLGNVNYGVVKKLPPFQIYMWQCLLGKTRSWYDYVSRGRAP